MRQFIISDLHGNGNVYNSIMSYLENINNKEPVVLYINGDLIDRGPDSLDMLLDIINRIKNGPFKIEYLAGNHELLMYDYYRKKDEETLNNWYNNGGNTTNYPLQDNLKEEEIEKVVDFISNLDIYKKFEEKVENKNIVLVHALCPRIVKDDCNLKLKNNKEIFNYLWYRKNSFYFPYISSAGNKDYFTIIGHTPNNSKNGFIYDSKEKVLNIDGGSSCYVSGLFDYDHVPLVEIKNTYLRILTFNNNNEITNGCYFDGEYLVPFCYKELEEEREYLNKDLKVKKLIKNIDGEVFYNE